MNEADVETTDHDIFAGRCDFKIFGAHAVLFEPTGEDAERKFGSVDGDGRNFFQDVGQGADVILMSVCKQNGT